MKTLVIHPEDPSTVFLKKIYEGKDWTIITDHDICRSHKEIAKLIKAHGRIIMMGHGTPNGLFYSCIKPSIVYLLREKLCVGIWCNADEFFNKYKLRGFFTGMFISEVREAQYFRIETTQEKIDYSNNLFATELNKHIDMIAVHSLIKESYVGDDPVIKFNNDRLYERDEDDTYESERLLAERDLKDEMNYFDDDDFDPAGGRGLHSHI